MASLLRWYTHKKPALAVQLSGKSQDAVSACAFEDCVTTHISLWLAGTQLAWSTSSPLATGRTGIRFLHFLLSSPTWPSLHHKFLLPMIHACTFCIAPSPHLGLSDTLLHCPSTLLTHEAQRLPPLLPSAQNVPSLHCCPDSSQQTLKPMSLRCSQWHSSVCNQQWQATRPSTTHSAQVWPLLHWQGLVTYRGIICCKTKAQFLYKLKKFPRNITFQDCVFKRPQMYTLVLVPKEKEKNPTLWVNEFLPK